MEHFKKFDTMQPPTTGPLPRQTSDILVLFLASDFYFFSFSFFLPPPISPMTFLIAGVRVSIRIVRTTFGVGRGGWAGWVKGWFRIDFRHFQGQEENVQKQSIQSIQSILMCYICMAQSCGTGMKCHERS